MTDEGRGNMGTKTRRVAVVGSGVSGLGAAFHLRRRGFQVDLLERADTLGGRLGVATLGERPVMMGGKNIGRRYTALREFIGAFGEQEFEPFGINASRVKDGKVMTIDSSRRGRTIQSLRQLGAPRDLARLLTLAARIRADETNRFLGSAYFTRVSRRADHAPLSAQFSREMIENFLRPVTVRMNGAEPDEVYLGTLGTNLGTMLDTFDQLTFGIQPVLAAFAKTVDVRLDTRVDDLLTAGRSVTGLRWSTSGQPTGDHPYDAVVLATPAHVTAGIVESFRPELSELLRRIHYFPSTVVLVEYDRPVFDERVRALAMDDGPCSNAGSYGAQDRHIVRYTFSGRHARTPDPSAEQIAAWVDEAEKRLARYVPVAGATRLRSVSRHWPTSYCGYSAFHSDLLAKIRSAVIDLPNLELAGDYLRGVSLEACFRSGREAAERVAAGRLTLLPTVA